MHYLLLGLAVAGISVLPLPLFPSWVLVAYLKIHYGLLLVPAIVVGALGYAVGRLVLVLVARWVGPRMLTRRSRANLDYLAERLTQSGGTGGAALVLAASPPPAGMLYVAAGLLEVPLMIVGASAFVGRLVGYAVWVTITSSAAPQLAGRLRGTVGPWSVAVAVAIIGLCWLALVQVDWRALLEHRRVRLVKRAPGEVPET